MNLQHPGKTLLNQYLQPNKLSQNKLGRAINVPPRRINEIVLGKRGITADTALRLATFFGNSASYWMHIQAEYDLHIAKEKLGQRIHVIQSFHHDEPIIKKSERNTPEIEQATTEQQPKNIKRRLMR